MTIKEPRDRKTPERINIKISGKAYRRLSRRAKREGRTILSLVDTLAV